MEVETRIFSSTNQKKIFSFSASLLSNKNYHNQDPFTAFSLQQFSCCTAMHLSSSYPLNSLQWSLPTTNFHSYILSSIETLSLLMLSFNSFYYPTSPSCNKHSKHIWKSIVYTFQKFDSKVSTAGSSVDWFEREDGEIWK